MDRTKVMELSEKTGGLFRLAVLLQKRVQELVAGAPKLIETKKTNPIDIAMLEVEMDAIELVDLSEAELEKLKEQSQMASDEAELLEALRTRMSSTLASQPLEAPKVSGADAADEKAKVKAKAKAPPADADQDESSDEDDDD